MRKAKFLIICTASVLLMNPAVYAAEMNQGDQPVQGMADTGGQEAVHQDTAPQPESGKEGDFQVFEPISTMMSANAKANVRIGPDMKYKSLGKLEVGQQIFVFGRLPGDWYQISYEGKNAYVSCDYLMMPEMDETLIEEMEENMSDNLSRIPETDIQVVQLQEELAAAKEAEAQARNEAEETKAQLTAERNKKEKYNPINLALIMAALAAAVFISGLVLAVRPDLVNGKSKVPGQDIAKEEEEEDGLVWLKVKK